MKKYVSNVQLTIFKILIIKSLTHFDAYPFFAYITNITIVRGKCNAKVEFGARIQVSQMNGFFFLDDLERYHEKDGG